MNYLFFDIECATSRGGKSKICEFGYFLCDEKFNALNKKLFLIDPDSPFDWYTIKNLLNYSKNDYLASPLFSGVYEEIASVLLENGVIVFGQATKNDMKFLKDECDRYDKPYLDFPYVDVGEIFKCVFNLDEPRSLEKMCEILQIELPDVLHTASFDAETTMLVLKALCEKESLKPTDFFAIYPSCYQKYDFTKKTKKELKALKRNRAN